MEPPRRIDDLVILLGVALLFVCLPHVVYSDGAVRFQMLSDLLERGEVSKHFYSYVGPLSSAPLWLLGKRWGGQEWWCARFNTIVFGFSIFALRWLMGSTLDRKTVNRFALVLIAASMFPFHVTAYFAEVYTACLVAVGLAAAVCRGWQAGWLLVVIGVVNTPGAMGGLCLGALLQTMRTRRWRYLLVIALAVGLNLAENWIRRGSPLDNGLSGYAVAQTVLPYSGRPGFSYPFFFGLISILLSFGRGLVYFAPGVFLRARNRFDASSPEIRRFYQLALAFLVGLVLLYSKWYLLVRRGVLGTPVFPVRVRAGRPGPGPSIGRRGQPADQANPDRRRTSPFDLGGHRRRHVWHQQPADLYRSRIPARAPLLVRARIQRPLAALRRAEPDERWSPGLQRILLFRPWIRGGAALPFHRPRPGPPRPVVCRGSLAARHLALLTHGLLARERGR